MYAGNQSYKKINLNLKPVVESTPTTTMHKKSGCRKIVPPLPIRRLRLAIILFLFPFLIVYAPFFFVYMLDLTIEVEVCIRSPRQFIFVRPLFLRCPFVVWSFLWICQAIFIWVCFFFFKSIGLFCDPDMLYLKWFLHGTVASFSDLEFIVCVPYVTVGRIHYCLYFRFQHYCNVFVFEEDVHLFKGLPAQCNMAFDFLFSWSHHWNVDKYTDRLQFFLFMVNIASWVWW